MLSVNFSHSDGSGVMPHCADIPVCSLLRTRNVDHFCLTATHLHFFWELSIEVHSYVLTGLIILQLFCSLSCSHILDTNPLSEDSLQIFYPFWWMCICCVDPLTYRSFWVWNSSSLVLLFLASALREILSEKLYPELLSWNGTLIFSSSHFIFSYIKFRSLIQLKCNFINAEQYGSNFILWNTYAYWVLPAPLV